MKNNQRLDYLEESTKMVVGKAGNIAKHIQKAR